MQRIIHVVDIGASRGTVYEALTTQDGLSKWWTTDVSADVREGGPIDFRFAEGFNPSMTIANLEEDTVVQWRCTGGAEHWIDNTFAFELSDAEAGAQVMFTQDYATEIRDEVYGMYNFNWAYYLNSLKTYCESGQGTPFQHS